MDGEMGETRLQPVWIQIHEDAIAMLRQCLLESARIRRIFTPVADKDVKASAWTRWAGGTAHATTLFVQHSQLSRDPLLVEEHPRRVANA